MWDEIKERWREILPALGLQAAKLNANGERSYICPLCGHGTHGDGLTFIPNGKKQSLHCFACNFSGSVIDLVMQWQGVNNMEALNICADAIGIDTRYNGAKTAAGDKMPVKASERQETPDYTAYYERCRERLYDPAAVAYLNGRGLSLETARAAGLGFDPQADPANYPGAGDDVKKKYPEPRLIIPCNASVYIGRAIDPEAKFKAPFCKGGHAALFRADLLNNNVVFVVEGWADALALAEVGAPAVSINSVSNADLLLSEIKKQETKPILVLCLDSDKAGQSAQEKLEKELKAAGVKYVKRDICGGAKDPAEALQENKPAFIKAVADAMEAAENVKSRDVLIDFWERIQSDAYKPNKTGLSWFDSLLDGGLIPQTLTIVMATPGSGKTALCQQLAEKMAENKNNVLYINLEMSNEQMLARAVSMKIAENAKYEKDCLTALEVLQGYKWTDKQREAVRTTLTNYRANNFHFIRYGATGSTIDEIIKFLDETGAAYQKAGKPAPAVILDYLHLVTGAGKSEPAEIIKQTVSALKLYTVKHNTLAVAISAINRASYSRITLSSGRDSSAVEYTGDTVLSLDYQRIDEAGTVDNEEMATLQQDPLRKMRLRVLKSRHCAPGRTRDLHYAAAYNLFYDPSDLVPDFAADIVINETGAFHKQKKAGKR